MSAGIAREELDYETQSEKRRHHRPCGLFAGGVCISTGYRPIGKYVPYELVHHFEDQARKLVMESDLDSGTERGMIDDLLGEFLREIMKEG